MPEPLVSVGMITYNHRPYIVKAIEGVLQQKTHFPFELVIGEDCSTDGTREIVFEYQKKYTEIIRVVTSDANVGGRENELRTMKACRGKYWAFCEGDDYWQSPEKLQKQADYLESHPDCGLVYSSFDVHHVGTGKRIEDFIKHRKWKMPENPRLSDFVEDRGELLVGILTCTVMTRRALYESLLDSDPYLHQGNHFIMGDTQLWAEISTKARLHFIPESLATHNITEDSVTRSRDIRKRLQFAVSGQELFLYLCRKYELPVRLSQKHEEQWCNYSLRLAFHTRNAEMAEEVRTRKATFTLAEWLRYWGSKHLAVYYFCCLGALFRHLFEKGNINGEWM